MNTLPANGHFASVNDMEMYYEIRGTGEPLVLLHGGTGVGSNWDFVFPEPPVGFQLVIPDLRGHGRSTNPAPDFTFRQLALDVFNLLDGLGIRVGIVIGEKTTFLPVTE